MAITLIADAAAQGGSTGVTTTAIDTSGANLIVLFSVYFKTSAVPTFSDNKGNTIVTSIAGRDGSSSRAQLLYIVNPTVGAGHTFTATGTDSYASLAVLAFAGCHTSAPFDQSSSSGTASSTGSIQPGSLTPSETGEVFVCGAIAEEASGTRSIGSSFIKTADFSTIGAVSFGVQNSFKIKTDATAENPTWSTSTGNCAWATEMACFKPASASPDATVNATGVSATATLGILTEPHTITGKVLVVAGGGGAPANVGGGGGGGGVLYDAAYPLSTGSHSVTVGAGGVGGSDATGPQTSGANSVFGTLTALGGGYGGNILTTLNGAPGGCGGGGGTWDPTSGTGGAGSQGGNGGYGVGFPAFAGGGGGGAGANGGNGSGPGGVPTAGNGGNGIANSITGSSVYYAGGGAGGFPSDGGTPGSGGLGGGGNSCGTSGCTGTSGTANTGGGGGAAASGDGSGGAGGSGVVIVAYPTASFTHTGGSASGTNGSDTWVQFNASGTLTLTATVAGTDVTVNASGVQATGEIGIPNPVVPGSTRINYYAESLGNTTTTSVTYASKCSLTFTTEATTDYWVLWGVRINPSVAPQGFVRLRDTTGAATLRGDIAFTAKDPTDLYVVWGIEKFTSVGAASRQLDIEVRGSTTSNCVFSHATITVIKADAADQYADSETDSNATTATLADKTTLTFTPGTTGDYLILASALFQCSSTTASARMLLDKNTGAATYGDCTRIAGVTTDILPWNTMVKQTALSGSNTFKLRYANPAATGTTSFRQAAILALRLDKFQIAQYAETRARGTTTSTTYIDKATFTFTPAAKSHLILGCGQVDGNSITVSVFAALSKAGTPLVENMHEARGATAASYVNSFAWSKVETLAASSTAFALQSKSETGAVTTGLAEAAVAVLEYAAAGTNAGMVAAGVSATGTLGTVSITAEQAGTIVPVTDVAATGTLGTVTVTAVANVDVSPSGVSATGAIGTVTVTAQTAVTVFPSNVFATGQIGTVVTSAGTGVSSSPTGVSTTGQLGTLLPRGDGNVTATNVATSLQVGTVIVATTASVTLSPTGVFATGQIATPTVTAGGSTSVTLSPVSATGTIGTVAPRGDANLTETGLFATGQLGTLTVTATKTASITVTGLEAACQLGNESVSAGGNVAIVLTGVEGTGQIGTVTVTAIRHATVVLGGVFATGYIGGVTVSTGDVEPPVESLPNVGGSITFGRRRKKRDSHVIRYSDFSTQEAYAAALSQAAIPLTRVSMAPEAVTPEDDFEDDDDILFAIVKLYH